MTRPTPKKVHLIAGGYPRGALAAHDMDYARLTLLELLAEREGVVTTVAANFDDLEYWLSGCDLLLTYIAGPVPAEPEHAALRRWLNAGGRWLGLHGTSGGKAARVQGGRSMVKMAHHETLGAFFLNHPPLRRFKVKVNNNHILAEGLPDSFEVDDELYLIEMQGDHEVLLSTEIDADPSPAGFGFIYPRDTSAQADGRTRVLGYTKSVGEGAVAYVALGHCHSPESNAQPFVDESISADGSTPRVFRGSWETAPFQQLLRNTIAWGVGAG